MEEKLDKIIELLQQQNKTLEKLISVQTTNNFTKQQSTRLPLNRGGQTPGVGADVKAMIEEAKAKAQASMQAQMQRLKG